MNPDKICDQPTLQQGPDNVAFEHEPDDTQHFVAANNNEYIQQQPQKLTGPQPSEGYVSIEDEIADLNFKLERLRKKGLSVRTFAGNVGELRDMRSELNRIKSEIEFENSLKFGKKALCGVVSVIEWLNQKYQPFDLQLEGWSESVMTGIDSYEGTLERLITKYRHRVNTPPEIELALSLAASGLMYHMTNTMFKQALLPGGAGGNPDLIKSMVGAFSGSAAGAQPPPPQPPPRPQSATTAPYQMKGPGINLGPLMQAMPTTPMPYPQQANPPPPTRLHPQQPTPKPATAEQPPPVTRVPEQQMTPAVSTAISSPATAAGEDDDERMSDIISEDLQSIKSVDLESISGSLASESVHGDDVKSFNLSTKASSNAAALRSKKAAARSRARNKAAATASGKANLKTFDI